MKSVVVVVAVVVAIAVVVVGSGEVGYVVSTNDGPGHWGEEAMSDLTAVTFDSSRDIVLCTAACYACNEEDSSMADSSWLNRLFSHLND
jgi:hypothetical protein